MCVCVCVCVHMEMQLVLSSTMNKIKCVSVKASEVSSFWHLRQMKVSHVYRGVLNLEVS